MIPGVPRGVGRRVLAAFVNALKTSPQLANRRVIKTWIVWDEANPPTVPPAVAAMPAIQVRMVGGPVERVAGARAIGGPMKQINARRPTVLVDLWTAGCDQGDLQDLAELVYDALSPQEDGPRAEVLEKFRLAGIKDYQLSREILPSSPGSFGEDYIEGNGSYQLTVFVNA